MAYNPGTSPNDTKGSTGFDKDEQMYRMTSSIKITVSSDQPPRCLLEAQR